MLALVGWTSGGTYEALLPVSTLQTSRSYAVQYIVLTKPNPTSGASPAARRRSPDREVAPAAPEQVAYTPAPAESPAAAPTGPGPNNASSLSNASSPSLDQPAAPAAAQELLPGEVSGIGQVESASGTNPKAETGILARLGFRPPTPEEVGSPKRGEDRVAELVTGTSSACPELEAPAAWPRPTLAVAVAFEVDTNGVVDQGSLRVVESPGHPQTDRRYHAHVYVVAATMRPDASPIDPAGYDSLVSRTMTRHAADLTFLPALEAGQPVRSSVLISCQMLQPG